MRGVYNPMNKGNNSPMFRLRLIDEKLYDAIIEVESTIAVARIALLSRRDSVRANNVMNEKFPELAESDLPLTTKIADAISSIDEVKAYLLDGDVRTARRLFKGQFPKTPL